MFPSTVDSQHPPSLAEIARRLVSPRTGVIHRLRLLGLEAGEQRAAHVHARLPNLGVLPGGGKIFDAGGSALDLQGAVAASLFEAVERYAAAFVDHRRLVLAKPRPGGPFLMGDELPLFTDAQYDQPRFPFRRLTPDSEIYWVEARSLRTGARAFVPAICVFIPYEPTSPAEWLGPCTSTGMASGTNRARAVAGGLFEVCERDAFMILWYHRLSLPRLRVDPASTLGLWVARLAERRGANVTFVNMTNDLRVPAVLAVLESRLHGKRLLTMGASAKPTLSEAAEKALLEAISDARRLRDMMAAQREPWRPAPGFTNVVDFAWHSLVYTDPELQPVLDFITASREEQEMGMEYGLSRLDGPALVEELVARVAARGEEPFVVELTTRDLADLGIHVVKVMVPGAVPMNPDHRFPWIAQRRLYAAPRVLGLRDRDAVAGELNLAYPHPFA